MSTAVRKIGSESKTKEFDLPAEIKKLDSTITGIKLVGNENKTSEFELPTEIKKPVVSLAPAPATPTSEPAPITAPTKPAPDIEKVLKVVVKELQKLPAIEKKLLNEVAVLDKIKKDIPKILAEGLKSATSENLSQKVDKVSDDLHSLQTNHLNELKNDIKEMVSTKLSEVERLTEKKFVLESDVAQLSSEKKQLEVAIRKLKEELIDLEMLKKL